MKKFKRWAKMKSIIEKYRRWFFAKPRDIIWAYIGTNIGTETCGHGNEWIRPVLIVKRYTIHKSAQYLIVPLTSSGTYLSRNDNMVYIKDFHHKITSIIFTTKDKNGNTKNKTSYAILNQIKTISEKRLFKKYYIGNKKYAKISIDEFLEIKNKIINTIN